MVRVTTPRRSSAIYMCMSAGSRASALEVGDVVEMAIDGERRGELRRAHSATHLLHAALRRQLGEHVTQKGSLVAPERLRFDFSHPKPVAQGELAAIEAEVNASSARTMRSRPADGSRRGDAAGAMALFGEKYGDEVRVVSMGASPMATPPRSSCAAARTACAPAISRCSRSPASPGSPPASAASKR